MRYRNTHHLPLRKDQSDGIHHTLFCEARRAVRQKGTTTIICNNQHRCPLVRTQPGYYECSILVALSCVISRAAIHYPSLKLPPGPTVAPICLAPSPSWKNTLFLHIAHCGRHTVISTDGNLSAPAAPCAASGCDGYCQETPRSEDRGGQKPASAAA